MAAVTGIHHVSLTVSDLQRSIAWYSDLFGLTKIIEEAHPDGSGTGVVLADQTFTLIVGLHAHNGNPGERFSESRTGLDHASIGVPDRSELVAWQQRLDSKAVSHSSIADRPYGSVLVFRDPDNIQLELFAPPGS